MNLTHLVFTSDSYLFAAFADKEQADLFAHEAEEVWDDPFTVCIDATAPQDRLTEKVYQLDPMDKSETLVAAFQDWWGSERFLHMFAEDLIPDQHYITRRDPVTSGGAQ